MASIQSLKTLVLDLPPSCIEFCPADPQYAVVGTYNLERSSDEESTTDEKVSRELKIPQSRNGSLILVKVSGDDVSILQTFSTPSAILDVHFDPHCRDDQRHRAIAVATSTGSIDLYTLSLGDEPHIAHSFTVRFGNGDVLVTAFCYDPIQHNIGATLSDGRVCLSIPLEDPRARSIGAHELEAWTLAFSPDGKTLFSGGDDSALKLWHNSWSDFIAKLEKSEEEDQAGQDRAIWTDKRIHGAGVTAILPLDLDSDLVITGSYDDHIRLLHAPVVGRRSVPAELHLGGGVWRIKQLSKHSDGEGSHGLYQIDLLVSCMHAGARIVRLSRNAGEAEPQWQFDVLAKFEEHKSMNYGSDFAPPTAADGKTTFITTSFYDRLLCLWRY